MPYIPVELRQRFDEGIGTLADALGEPTELCCGELNYVITSLIVETLRNLDAGGYRVYNEIIGVLECVKQEYYRRIVAPYENEKWANSKDVFK